MHAPPKAVEHRALDRRRRRLGAERGVHREALDVIGRQLRGHHARRVGGELIHKCAADDEDERRGERERPKARGPRGRRSAGGFGCGAAEPGHGAICGGPPDAGPDRNVSVGRARFQPCQIGTLRSQQVRRALAIERRLALANQIAHRAFGGDTGVARRTGTQVRRHRVAVRGRQLVVDERRDERVEGCTAKH